MEKHLTLIFYGSNDALAKAAAAKVRGAGNAAQLRNAVAYGGEVEPCDAVRILSDVSAFDRSRIEAAYGDKATATVERQEKPKLGLPPAPGTPPAAGKK